MPSWKPKDTNKNRNMADKIARYYYAYFNFMGHKPTNKIVGMRFSYSDVWASIYLRFARELGFIKNEWIVRIENRKKL
jgi:hypothetical protein